MKKPQTPRPQSPGNYAQYYNYQQQQPYRKQPGSASPYYQQYYQQPYATQTSGYAGNYNNYAENPVTNFLDTLSQGASSLFSGAATKQEPSAYYSGHVVGLQRPQANGNVPGSISPINQFGKAIDGITKNDDLQCIPKIICQMVGGQKQQNMMSPLFSA